MNPDRRYAPSTVIDAQRRVLRLALATISQMPNRQLTSLRHDGYGGLITFNELIEHIEAAAKLKVRR